MSIFKIFSKKAVAHQVDVTIPKDNIWIGENIPYIREDGYIFYECNRVTREQRNAVNLYGCRFYSKNGKYCAVYLDDLEADYNLVLISVDDESIVYKIKAGRPHRVRVTNSGLVIVDDWVSHTSKKFRILILNRDGAVLYEKIDNYCCGETFFIDDEETVFTYNNNYTGEIHQIKLDLH